MGPIALGRADTPLRREESACKKQVLFGKASLK
jgi:hypothetical protein